MKTSQTQVRPNAGPPVAVQTGLDEVVEFQIPEPGTPDCFFSLGEDPGSADLVVVVDDFVAGETEYHIDFDEVVDGLLETFAEESPATFQGKLDDAAKLKRLAQRFQSVGARLLQEARRREVEVALSRRLMERRMAG